MAEERLPHRHQGQEGAEHLRLAGEKHGELELIYRPFVDFAAAEEMTRAECRRIFGAL